MLQELRVRPGEGTDLEALDAASTPGVPGDSVETAEAARPQLERLGQLQERLVAERRRSLLVIVQGMDCSGKDESIRHLMRGLNPAGARVVTFKAPTADEPGHEFLWRVHPHAPGAGEIAVFNRSHYEDVTTVRVRRLAPEQVWMRRFEHINAFERLLGHGGTRMLKVFLHVSKAEQARRLRARAEDPRTRWRVTPDDVADHERYAAYLAAFDDMIDRTSTDQSPWWVVPSDHDWYRNWAFVEIVLRTLADMDPRYPDLPPIKEVADL